MLDPEVSHDTFLGSRTEILLFSILRNLGSFTLNHYQELRLLHTGGPAGATAAGEGAAGGLQRTGRGSGAQPQQQRGAAARQRRGGERAGQPPAACSGQVHFLSHCQCRFALCFLGWLPRLRISRFPYSTRSATFWSAFWIR